MKRMTFDEWYYVGDKCDTRFDDWTENRNSYYYCKEAWSYQQQHIEKLEHQLDLKLYSRRKLESDNKKMREALEFYAATLTCPGQQLERLQQGGKRARAVLREIDK